MRTEESESRSTDGPDRAELRAEALTLFRQETFRNLLRDDLTEEEEQLLRETDPEKIQGIAEGNMQALGECLEKLRELGVELTPRELREMFDALLLHAWELVDRHMRRRKGVG